MNTAYIEIFESDENELKPQPSLSLDELDNELGKLLEDIDNLKHTRANDTIREIYQSDFIRNVLGDIPAAPSVRKAYGGTLVKDMFGGSVAVIAPVTVPPEMSRPKPKTPASDRRTTLKQLIENCGIAVSDANSRAIENLITSIERFVDGHVKAARTT